MAISLEKVHFKQEMSCTDQVLSLSPKTTEVSGFVDFKAAYYTG